MSRSSARTQSQSQSVSRTKGRAPLPELRGRFRNLQELGICQDSEDF
jgi:hypothetical protein